jgi:Raf kinase inhibitor-like YbhB/YbcL family protein
MARPIHLACCTLLFAAVSATATEAISAEEFKVSSHDLASGSLQQAQFVAGFGCSGGNISPDIHWQGVPQGTKSFVVTMYDPDAPTGSGWWHWVVANIPADVHELKEGAGSPGGALPKEASQIRGDSGDAAYIGACPPAGQVHHYVITVNALKVEKLDLPPQVTPAMLGFMTLGNSLGKATLVAKGSR